MTFQTFPGFVRTLYRLYHATFAQEINPITYPLYTNGRTWIGTFCCPSKYCNHLATEADTSTETTVDSMLFIYGINLLIFLGTSRYQNQTISESAAA